MSQEIKTSDKNDISEVKRDEKYVEKVATKITKEIPHELNQFHAKDMFVHGYRHVDLVEKRSFVDTMFLLFQGELPDKSQEMLLEKLFCCLINLGPRHPATRASMNAGVARTKIEHMLPMALSVASGDYLGSEDVFNCMKFLQKNVNADPAIISLELLKESDFDAQKNPQVVNGFGSYFGGADPYTQLLVNEIKKYSENGRYLEFADSLVSYWQNENPNIGWLITGLAASVFCELGFRPRHGHALFQIAIAPGLAAHGIEKASQPATAMPFTTEDKFMLSESNPLSEFQPKEKNFGDENE